MKLLIFIIIITLILIIYFLKSKLNEIHQIYELFGNLLNTSHAKYQQTENNLSVNQIQINPNNLLNITELSGNVITSQDVLASNVNLNILKLNPNIVYNKFILDNPIISNIKTEEIQNFLSFDIKKNYMYDPNSIIIYENISNYTNLNDASGTLGTDLLDTDLLGTTIINFKPIVNTWNRMAFGSNPYAGLNIFNLGVKGTGIEFAIPANCNVLWLTSLTDRFVAFKICGIDETTYGIYAGGKNYNNNINPGGTVSTLLDNNYYSWIQIPLYWLNNSTPQSQRKVKLYCYLNKNATYNDDAFWVSKIAFTTNPWNHVLVTPQMMYYDTNSTTYIPSNINKAVYTTSFIDRSADIPYTSGWMYSDIIRVRDNTNFKLRIPIIKSGKNKVLYFISINRSFSFDVLQVSLVDSNLNLIKLDNLKSTFLNPFATYFNSKNLNSYRATIIPDSLITLDSFRRGFVTINIFLPSGSDFFIRELGTHDEN